jgi:hypothetical protein
MSEWYPENLQTLLDVMDALPDLAAIDGLFEIEVRIRVDDMDTWAVIGYGESGDPCVLRFEEPVKVVPVKPTTVTTINPPNWGTGLIDCRKI